MSSISKGSNLMGRIYQAAEARGFAPFNEVPELEGLEYDDLAQFENFGGLSVPYKEEYLEENREIELFFPREEKEIKIRTVIELSEETLLLMRMTYDYEGRFITYEPISISDRPKETGEVTHYYDEKNVNMYLKEFGITKEDIAEYQHYALYDVVVRTWVKTHGGDYEEAKKRMEKVKTFDNTYEFTEEGTKE